jgi:hypothetical protein
MNFVRNLQPSITSRRTERIEKIREMKETRITLFDITKPKAPIPSRLAVLANALPRTVLGPFDAVHYDETIIDIFATCFVENIAHAFATLLKDCGMQTTVNIRNLTNNDIDHARNQSHTYLFIFCPQILLQSQNQAVYPSGLTPLPPNKYYLYQLEQLDVTNLKYMNTHMTRLIQESKQTFDYSEINLPFYSAEVRDKVSVLMPPMVEWPAQAQQIQAQAQAETPTQKYDVIFCGHLSKRREKIINEIKAAGYSVLHLTNSFGPALTEQIKKARIFLNIHHSAITRSLETCRLNEAVQSTAVHMISEKSGQPALEKLYEGRVHFVETADILQTIKAVLPETTYSTTWYNYTQLNHLTVTTLFNCLNLNYTNKKILHRYNCYVQLGLIKHVILPEITQNNVNETILIEFRPMLQLEFLLRNTILKLPEWSHTVVCGNLNYKCIKSICDRISANITIIRLNIDNLTPSDYSKLLMTKDFWLNFKGEKLLLYQEDTMLFHNQTAEFLQYDYIGAAWPIDQDDNLYGVGNGGFSLRSKAKMIECIEKVNPETDLQLGQSTLAYMKATDSYCLPEDVYFSKALIDHNLGLVATRDVANKFSQETQLCENPLGGHNFWLAPGNKLTVGNTLVLETEYFKTVSHRGGWKTIINNLIENNIVTPPQAKGMYNTIKFIDSVESCFLWNKRSKPMIENWIGVIHYSPNLPTFIEHDLNLVLKNPMFIQSLKYCKGLVVFSQNSLNYIKANVNCKDINIIKMYHPIKTILNIVPFEVKDNCSIIQLGQQDRKLTTIYKLKTKYKKIWLPGSKNKEHMINLLNRECKYLSLRINLSSVDINYFENNVDYDNLLKNSIVIIPLWGASANNSIMEIIEMNIPAFVSRVPAAEEYLGKDYPMFYSDDFELETMINNPNELYIKMKETYEYLCKMNKNIFKLEYFNSELVKNILNIH